MRRAYHVFFASPLPPSGLWSFRKLLDHYSGSNHISFKINLGVFPACDANARASAKQKTTVMKLAVTLLKGGAALVKVKLNQRN